MRVSRRGGATRLPCAVVLRGDVVLNYGALGFDVPRWLLSSHAAVPVPGHSGAAEFFGPAVCFKCSATHTTHTHQYLLSPCVKTRWSLPTPRGGYWPSCALLVIGREKSTKLRVLGSTPENAQRIWVGMEREEQQAERKTKQTRSR